MTDLELREDLLHQATLELLLASSGDGAADFHCEVAKGLTEIEEGIAGRSATQS